MTPVSYPYPLLRRVPLVCALLIAAAAQLLATHNRAGEIRIEQVGTTGQVRAIVTTYTAFLGPSAAADRPQIEISWGDGTTSVANRTNGPLDSAGIGPGVQIAANIKVNEYTITHVYSNARGAYRVSVLDPNRIADIRNISNSSQQFFFLQTVFTFLDPVFQGPNSTPILLQPPIDDGCVGQPFVHNPNAFDPDGDSLAYRLGVPLGEGGVQIASHQFPNAFTTAGQSSSYVLDEVTGTLTWRSPQQAGNYNTVILVISYRSGVAIDTTVRDMQINITPCDNEPPAIEVADEYCLVAGEAVEIEPVATAPIAESAQRVLLDPTSATFDLALSPATWSGDSSYQDQPYSATYRWQTVCEHSERYPYNVIFKATDDFAALGGGSNLSWLEVVQLRVSAPPPDDLRIDANDGLIDLDWAAPYACEATQDSFFFGFSVWRREGSNPFPYDSCRQGLDGRGYTKIAGRTREQSGGRYVYTDDDIERGRTYCYRVLAQFVRYTQAGRPFNLVESIPSVEVCIQSSRDLPLLTRADVLTTGTTDGEVDVRWTPPVAEDLDTLENGPPYVNEVLRSPGIGTSDFTPVPGTRRSFNSYAELARDTQYVDTGLNTLDRGYTYAVRFTSEGDDNGLAPLSSSTVFLNVASTDQLNRLSWDFETSWENQRYAVLRENDLGVFDTVARVTSPSYDDAGLTNGEEYCYQIVAFGTYGVSTIYSPLVNRSQRACGVPLDTIPPCPPVVTVRTLCDDEDESAFDPADPTLVRWAFEDCPPAPDLTTVRVYELSDSVGTERTLLGEVAHPTDVFSVFNEFSVAGCYAVTAVDSLGNESALSAAVCVEDCPLYILPNVITPNGDGAHEVLRPRLSRFVERVELVVVDRWGVEVYRTEDPALGWDATTPGGDPVSEGTYYYTCAVFQRRSDGAEVRVGEEPLSGFIEVMR